MKSIEMNRGPVPEGLFNRIHSIFKIVGSLPEHLSDEEVEGLIKMVPPDLANTIQALFSPSHREAGLPTFKAIGAWIDGAKQAKKEGKKVILLPFTFPPELIYAFDGAYPIISEVVSNIGIVALEGQGERYWDYALGLGLPDHICSANAIALGSILSRGDFEPDAVVSSCVGSCDVNAKIHEFVSLYLDIPQFILAKPPDNTQRGLDLYIKNYIRMVEEMEDFIGETLQEERLRLVAERANHSAELYYDVLELMRQVPSPVPGGLCDLIGMLRIAMWGREDTVNVLEKCVEVFQRNLQSKEHRSGEEIARVIWIYIGYYFDFLNLYGWFEEKKIANLGALVMTSLFMKPIDTGSRDSILRGMAENTWNNSMTRLVGGDSMSVRWVDDVVYAIKKLNADMAIFCGHHSCKQTWSVFSIARNDILQRTGVPILGLQGDSFMRTVTPITVIQKDIEQFIDNVVVKRRRKNARKYKKN